MPDWPPPTHAETVTERCICYDHPDVRTIVRMVGKLPEEWQVQVVSHLAELYLEAPLNLQTLATNIVNQLFDLAEVPVEKRQEINDQADEFVYKLLACNITPPETGSDVHQYDGRESDA